MTHLTGRMRYRIETRWFRPPLVVLQVEEVCEWRDIHEPFYKTDVTRWRDATVGDITTAQVQEKA